jgi:hypothetical protein
MVKRLRELKISLNQFSVDGRSPYKVSEDDWKVIDVLIIILEPFMIFQEHMEGEKCVTISLIPFMIEFLRTNLEQLLHNYDALNYNEYVLANPSIERVTESARSLVYNHANAMLCKFEEKWGTGEPGRLVIEHNERGLRRTRKGIHRLALLAAAVDPRTKHLTYLMHTQDQSDVKALLRKEMNTVNQPAVAVVDNQQISESSSVRPAVTNTEAQILPQKRTIAEMFNSSSSIPVSQNPQQSIKDILDSEFENFQSCNKIAIDDDPLAWWKLHEHQFPHIAKIARKCLAIPATSASSERVFSVAGLIVTKLRNRLDSSVVSAIVLLRILNY